MSELPYRPGVDGQGVLLAVRLSPRASRNAVEGVVAGADGRAALSIKLNAPPVDGAANEALVRFVAAGLGIGKSAVAIKSGHTARQKLLHIAGAAPDLLHRIDKWLNPAPSRI
ncbi:DUF167 domain-containing protein [Zavarzinia compransoris]|uniref:UPF0235 protein DKG75_07025 n=1 Tax=Zavarzinia compransoris TaxID=1264899 RepID=A0A317E508_9PROT|nr:DUF167 domain-containing protein [Zavarzinia compransoris]PWR21741.1 hypothetical protein DKG75_07025 [Zavarzinia compransoris]TDP45469.1 hypothetical protein DES42_105173 [Zavarzinia compransoris]